MPGIYSGFSFHLQMLAHGPQLGTESWRSFRENLLASGGGGVINGGCATPEKLNPNLEGEGQPPANRWQA